MMIECYTAIPAATALRITAPLLLHYPLPLLPLLTPHQCYCTIHTSLTSTSGPTTISYCFHLTTATALSLIPLLLLLPPLHYTLISLTLLLHYCMLIPLLPTALYPLPLLPLLPLLLPYCLHLSYLPYLTYLS